MTDDGMHLPEVVQKSDGGDVLKTIAEPALRLSGRWSRRTNPIKCSLLSRCKF